MDKVELSPSNKGKTLARATALGLTGAAVFGLSACGSTEVTNPEEYSSCVTATNGETPDGIVVYPGAVGRKTPVVTDLDGHTNRVITINSEDGDKDQFETQRYIYIANPAKSGGQCIRVATGYANDGNGEWYGVPTELLLENTTNESTRDKLSDASTGIIWFNTQRADIVTQPLEVE